MKPVVHEARSCLPGLLSRVALIWMALLLFACERTDASFMRVTRVSQDEEAGLLFVHGEGFFPGAKGTATLRGTLFRPFGVRSAVTRSWPCRATSESALLVRLDSVAGERGGLLEGSLEVTFHAKESERTFVAESDQLVRLRVPEPALSEVLAQSRAARTFASALGVSVEPHASGLLVVSVTDGGRAALAGVQPRDILRRIDGAPLEQAIDFVPSPRSLAPLIEFERAGNVSALTVPLASKGMRADLGPLFGLAFALAFITILLLPIAVPEMESKHDGKALALGAALTLGSALVVSWGLFDLRWAFVLPGLAFVVTKLTRDPQVPQGAIARARMLLPLSGLAIGVASLAVLSAERSDFFHALSTPPHAWLLFCAPPAWLAWFSIRHGLPTSDPNQSLALRVMTSWLMCTTAWLVVVFALGGDALWPRTLGAWPSTAIVIAKTALVVHLLSLSPPWSEARARWISLAVPVASAVWLALEPSATMSSVIGYGCMGTVVAMTVKHFLAPKQRQALLRPDPLFEPFR